MPSHNADLLTAERELGRLVQALADHPLAAGYTLDARRREAHASLQLDGMLVALEDIAAAQIDPMLLPGPHIAGAEAALALIRAGERMRAGLRADVAPHTAATDADADLDLLPPDDDDPIDAPLEPEQAPPSFMIDTRALLADIDAFLESRRPTPRAHAAGRLEPLTTAWLTKAWALACGDPDPAEAAALAGAADAIDTALATRPGLAGVALALHRLHAPGCWPEPAAAALDALAQWEPAAAAQMALLRAERQQAGPGWRFVRLITPWLIGRACHLPTPGPWISEMLLAARHGYAAAVTADARTWEGWLARVLADGLPLQRRRLGELQTRIDVWRARLGAGRRPGRGGPLAMLPLLVEYPVLTADWLARRQGISMRAAQMKLAELAKAGIMQETTGGNCYKRWHAS